MGWILDFFFSGAAADVVLITAGIVVIWLAWTLRYNRE